MTNQVDHEITSGEFINGIIRLYTGRKAVAFYSVFCGIVRLDTAFDADDNELTDGKAYEFFKGFETILTKNHGHKYCHIHSRKLSDGICDVCTN